MKRLIAFCMLVMALVACMAPAATGSDNLLTAGNEAGYAKVCSDLRPHTNPYD